MSNQPAKTVQDLLAKARQGDQKSREVLFEQCREYVALLARARIESWMQQKIDASDIVQQTLLDAIQGLEKFQGDSEEEWLAWLRQVLTHNVQDFIRSFRTAKRAAGKERPLATAGDDSSEGHRIPELADSLATPSQILMKHEHELALARAIGQLSLDHREVIELRNLQRLPFDQVAERMGRSRPATQMLWTRAIKKLEEILTSNLDRS